MEQIGPYKVVAELRASQLSELYLVEEPSSKEQLLLRLLRTELLSHDATKRMKREAELARHLVHPNLGPSPRYGEADGRPYLVSEYQAGAPLTALVARGRASAEVSVAIILGILEGLAAAHNATGDDGAPLGILHRAVCPENILITTDGTPKLVGFGFSRSHVDEFRTTPGMVVGPVRYLSPEQAISRDLSPASDLYSLGAVLYELLSGRPLVPELPLQDTLHFILHEAPPLERLDLPPPLRPVLERALSKPTSGRFSTAAEFRDALLGTRLQPASSASLRQYASPAAPEEDTGPDDPKTAMTVLAQMPEVSGIEAGFTVVPVELTSPGDASTRPGPFNGPFVEPSRAEPEPTLTVPNTRRSATWAIVVSAFVILGAAGLLVRQLQLSSEAPVAEISSPQVEHVPTTPEPAPLAVVVKSSKTTEDEPSKTTPLPEPAPEVAKQETRRRTAKRPKKPLQKPRPEPKKATASAPANPVRSLERQILSAFGRIDEAATRREQIEESKRASALLKRYAKALELSESEQNTLSARLVFTAGSAAPLRQIFRDLKRRKSP